ncbi:hypothetical protein O6H91_04G118100 [Diphasiastrum complanatum]|uniref:Uncharacterized protein n=1 Tax=Diphasiastrum complanatum TaxID=34168 RepID=A0ACC2E137_DIPCM|nr:hypothetical protein O6H91_04G118100 [Diphasiastrum complanatum]
MSECKPISTPYDSGCKPTKAEEDQDVDETLYRKLVGSLIYLTNTRPDIAYVVSMVSQFMAKPKQIDWKAAKQILRYVQGTLRFGILYGRQDDLKLQGYVDVDWARDAEDRRSTTRYVFSLGSGAISWSSKKQHTIALSSTEAEYRATTSATCEAIWLRRILHDLHMVQDSPMVLQCDNKSCIKLAKNPVFHSRTKHIEVQQHFFREKIQSGEVELIYCPTEEQVANIFIKGLGKEKFQKFRELLGVLDKKVKIKGEC